MINDNNNNSGSFKYGKKTIEEGLGSYVFIFVPKGAFPEEKGRGRRIFKISHLNGT